jgi:hypothetical protein
MATGWEPVPTTLEFSSTAEWLSMEAITGVDHRLPADRGPLW